jgi:protein SCO1/2
MKSNLQHAFNALVRRVAFGIACMVAAQPVVAKGYTTSVHVYQIPEAELVNQNGDTVNMSTLVQEKKSVILDFAYTSCRSVCPIVSATFANVQFRLRGSGKDIGLISISTDPEKDGVPQVREYLRRFRATAGWDFLTGEPGSIAQFMNAFSKYTKNKMGYYPLVFVHAPSKNAWVQIEGFISADELIDEYNKAMRQ